MLTFTKAPTVQTGDPITSKQFRLLAKSFNDRLRSGVGDCDWRVAWLVYNLWRQVRNPSAEGFVFPPQGEFFDIFQPLEPEFHQGTTWPQTGPGDPEGANLANPMAQFVYGIEDPAGVSSLDSEADRMNSLPFLPPDQAVSPTIENLWELGKQQRGAYEPATGAQNTPAFDKAQDVFRIVQPYWSPHGKAYGGWLPSPVQLISNCGGVGDGVPSLEIKFTSLLGEVDTAAFHGTPSVVEGHTVVTYAGSCPCGSTNYAAGHVLGIAAGPFAYYVFVGNGGGFPPNCEYDVDVFPVKNWIEGLYTGEGILKHTEGKQLQRALWKFQTDYRGTPSQRTPDSFAIEQIAFDNQDFFTRQYPLSPNIGVTEGAGITAKYPTAEFGGAGVTFVPQGTLGDFPEGETHVYADGFVLGGVFAKASNLSEPCAVEFLDGETVIARLSLTPAVPQAVKFLPDAGQVELQVRLASDARFVGTGSIVCEATEQLKYKPEFWDAYLVSRIGASHGGSPIGSGVDGRGKDTDFSKQISDTLFSVGCISQPDGVRQLSEWINDNPVFDNARRASKDVRILRRQQLVSYEVTGGKSVLRFKRFPQYPGIDGVAIRADLFDGIAPPLDPVDTLQEGETYIVRATSGQVIYRGAGFANDQTFTATSETSFQAIGDALVYVHDGIKHTALKKSLTNEWIGFIQTKCYNQNPTSVWKPEAYSDYFTWCERCHFYSGTAPSFLRRFFNFNHSTSPLDPVTFTPILNDMAAQAQFLSPEAPTGFRYAAGSNTNPSYTTPEFFKSCQLYEAPWEIESCVVDDWADDQIIKVTLTGRLRAHPDAPATVDKDPLTWSTGERDDLAAEDYRTPDNAVREYVLSQVAGDRPCTFKVGDAGIASSVSTLPDNPFGSCFPHFIMIHLVPGPFEDDNETIESHDTRCTVDAFQQMETYLRAFCEGFIDQRTSQEIICATGLGNLYNYTFENLCFDGFGGRWIGAFDLTNREDSPSGFGPLPNTVMYAEVFDRLAKCVNLLDKVRLDLPLAFKARTFTYYDEVDIESTLTFLINTGCTTGGTFAAYRDNVPTLVATTLVPPGPPNPTDWDFFMTIEANKGNGMTGCPCKQFGTRQDVEYRIEIVPDFLDAVPDALKELIDNGNTGFIVSRTRSVDFDKRESVIEALGDHCPSDGLSAFWTNGSEFYRWTHHPSETIDCLFVDSGVLVADAPPACDQHIGRSGGMTVGVFCSGGANSSVSYSLIAESNAFIRVPIVEAE